MTRKLTAIVMIFLVLATGCQKQQDQTPITTEKSLPLPDVKPAAALPQFTHSTNEIQIAQSFNDVDPSWVIGALVNVKTGEVYALDSYLKAGAKPVTTPQTDVVFRNFIENSVAANAQWLEFVKTEVSDTTRAEVSVAKTSKVSIDSQSVDKPQLIKQIQANKIVPRQDFGVVIGYTTYMLSATYFKNMGASASVSGYGAKIGGNWYSKSENSAVQHKIVATWSPLPFVIETVENKVAGSFVDLTAAATATGAITIPRVEKIEILEKFNPIRERISK